MTAWLYRAALTLVFVTAALLALRQVGSMDVGFHLKAGETILAEGAWPTTDPFTYTVRDRDYLDTSWGYQVLLVGVFRVLGVSGMTLLHVGLTLGTLCLLWLTSQLGDADPLSTVLFLTLGVWTSEMRFEVRPEGLSYFLLAAVLYLLQRYWRDGGTPLYLLPPIFLVWVNCHSLVVLGYGALACFVVGTTLRGRAIDRRLVGWSLGSLAAGLLNPYGVRALTFPLTLATRMSDSNVFGQNIGEFVPPLALRASEQFPFIPWVPVNGFRILLVLALISAAVLLRRRHYAAALLVLPGVGLGLQMVRNLPLLVLFSVVGVIWALPLRPLVARIFAARAVVVERTLLVAFVLLAAVLALRVVNDAYYVDDRRAERFGLGWNRVSQPIEAVAHAERAGLAGPVLNHLNFGGYLMWARPEPVFIDGRLEVMGERFFDDYRAVMGTPEGLAAAVSRYDIRWIVFPYKIGSRLLGRLSQDPAWRLTHVDALAVVFVRDDGAAAAGLPPAWAPGPAASLGPLASEALPGLGGPAPARGLGHWLGGALRRRTFPGEAFSRGLFHYFRGEMRHAAASFARAIRDSDGAYYEIYNNLGATLARLGRPSEAAECYRAALAAAPDSPSIRKRLEALDPKPSGR